MAKTKTQKQEDVKKLTGKLSRAKSVVFADYRGMTMGQLSDIRNKLQTQDAEFNVTKNTLLNLALKEAGLPTPPAEVEKGPTATLFSYNDEVSPIKTLVKALKDFQIGPSTTLRIKGGFLDAMVLDSLAVNKLASLPSKQELQGQVVGLLASPLYGIVGVLQANIRNLVYALDQIKQQRG